MRKMAAIAALSYLALCEFAQAQMTVVSDARALTTWSGTSIKDMDLETSFYSGVLSYRGPQLVNVWAVGGMDWPIDDHYTGAPPSAVTAGFDVVDQRGWTIGFAASNTYVRAALSNNGEASVSGVGGTLYARYTRGVGIGDLTLAFQATIDSLNTNFNRNEPAMGGLLLANQANVNSWAWMPSAAVSYQFTERWFNHGPIAGIQTLGTTVDGFSETGSVTSRSFTEQDAVSTTGYVGYSGVLDFLNLQPFALIKANYLLSSAGNSVQTGFNSGPGGPLTSFSSIGPQELWGFTTQVGTRIFVTPAITAFVAWNADYNDHFGPTENQALVGASYAF
jgi:uncharacterized protein YhjY with autotransporter beta-barrel domain